MTGRRPTEKNKKQNRWMLILKTSFCCCNNYSNTITNAIISNIITIISINNIYINIYY